MAETKPAIFTATVQELYRVVIPDSMRTLWNIAPKDILELKILGVHKQESK